MRSEGEPGETVLLPSSRSSKKEGGPEKARISKDPPKSDYDRSLTKSFEAAQKKTRAGKGVAQLG